MNPDTVAAAMSAALTEALKGNRTRNPLVGAILLSGHGTVIATGFHRGAGAPHAEAEALNAARLEGADLHATTLIVTLEPCAHHGLTPPCAHLVADAGIRRVIYLDADQTVAAGGAQYLLGRGVEVVKFDDVSRFEEAAHLRAANLNARWFRAQAEKRPFVIAKSARTHDGFIAAADGTSQWITGTAARVDAHELRARVDAIAVGTGTAIADNPSLTARDAHHRVVARPQPVVFGISTLAPGSRIASEDTIRLSGADLASDLRYLLSRGVKSLLVEGGGKLVSSFLSAGLVDQYVSYVSPDLLGMGTPAVSFAGIGTLPQRQQWGWDLSGPGPYQLLGAGPETDLRIQTIPLEG